MNLKKSLVSFLMMMMNYVFLSTWICELWILKIENVEYREWKNERMIEDERIEGLRGFFGKRMMGGRWRWWGGEMEEIFWSELIWSDLISLDTRQICREDLEIRFEKVMNWNWNWNYYSWRWWFCFDDELLFPPTPIYDLRIYSVEGDQVPARPSAPPPPPFFPGKRKYQSPPFMNNPLSTADASPTLISTVKQRRHRPTSCNRPWSPCPWGVVCPWSPT